MDYRQDNRERNRLPLEFLQREESLYLASLDDLLDTVVAQDNGFNSLMVVAHNPGLTDFANFLVPGLTNNLPTAVCVCVEIDRDDWSLYRAARHQTACLRLSETWAHSDYPRSALGNIDRQTTPRRFFVVCRHVDARLAHRLDNLIQRHFVRAIAVHRQLRSVDRLYGPHRVALNARYLHQPTNRVTGEAQIVFHADFGRLFYIVIGATQRCREATCGHRTRNADFTLTTHLGPGDRRIALVQHTDRTGR